MDSVWNYIIKIFGNENVQEEQIGEILNCYSYS